MKLTSLQTISAILLRGMDKTTTFLASDALELEPIIDGQRRDVVIRREGFEDAIVWQENIACATIEAAEANPEVPVRCGDCGRDFKNERALGAHIQRSHKAA